MDSPIDLNLKITGNLPGEQLMVALLNRDVVLRQGGMDPDILKRWDAILIQQAEDLQGLWRGLWVKAGILK